MIRTVEQCYRLYRNVTDSDTGVKMITYETASAKRNYDVNKKSFVMYFHNHTVTPNFTTEKIESVDDVESESLEGSEVQQEIPAEALLPEGDESALVTNSDSPEVVPESEISDPENSGALNSTEEPEVIADRLELLIPNVLDSAEATNAAAEVTAKAVSSFQEGLDRLHERADVLTEAGSRSTILSTRILIGSVTALVVSAFVYGFMAYQLATRTSQIDAMLMAVGKRIVKMNSALATFEQINVSIDKLASQQKTFEEAQSSVIEAVEKAEKTVAELRKTVPEQAAERVGKNTDKVAVQINKLKQKVDDHSVEAAKFNKSVGELSNRMSSFERKLSDVKNLNLDVAALVKLERERYLEALQKKTAIEEAQLRSQLEKEELLDPSIIKYPKPISANES